MEPVQRRARTRAQLPTIATAAAGAQWPEKVVGARVSSDGAASASHAGSWSGTAKRAVTFAG